MMRKTSYFFTAPEIIKILSKIKNLNVKLDFYKQKMNIKKNNAQHTAA